MNARMQKIESDAGNVEALRVEPKRKAELRLVEDREWTEAFLTGERRILEMIAKGDSLVPILDAMCRLVEEMSSGSLATILLLDAEGKCLRHAAAPSLPTSYTEAMGDIPVGPSVGSCGTAAYRREPVFAADIATDPLWTDTGLADFTDYAEVAKGIATIRQVGDSPAHSCWQIFYEDLGADHFNRSGKPNQIERLAAKIQSLGYGIEIKPLAA